ncbi:class I SAM-dependent methyltransferase [Marinobacterium stanieri]|uniref:class I SAM-dependent methyltransferase n=1 Tax=Marinobacterium stanieri TaxID=49186 RepID=UPI000255A599|nr:class I SAM-dependent methyltransferase [Marinobacterium stanieri]
MSLAVGWCQEEDRERAEQLAQRLALPLVAQPDLDQAEPWAQILYVCDGRLSLCVTGRKRPGPIRADFVTGAVAHRRQFGGGTGQLIAKACGIRKGIRPRVLDATAGLGRDAFVLATLGCQVQMIERSPVVHALLEDGLEEAHACGELDEILTGMELLHGDASELLATLAPVPDIIYLDPMYPHTDKKALVKKEMLAFRTLVGEDADDASLLQAALAVEPCRVVVKRPRKAPAIDGPAPNHQVIGKSSRYDIYTFRALPNG